MPDVGGNKIPQIGGAAKLDASWMMTVLMRGTCKIWSALERCVHDGIWYWI